MAKSLGALIIDLALNTARIDKGITSTNKKLDNFGRKVSSIASIAAGAFAGISFYKIGEDLIDIVDKYKLLEGRLKLVQREGENLAATQQKLFDLANRTRQGVGETVDFYTQLARSTKSLNLEQSALLQVTETINKAIIISGASAQSANAALFQLQQGLASGTWRGQEFNSVLEQTPRVAEAIASGLGVTIGQLRKLAEEGKLTAGTIIGAIQKEADVLDKEFAEIPITVAQNMQLLTNEFENAAKGAGGFNKVINASITSLINWVKAYNALVNPNVKQRFDDAVDTLGSLRRQIEGIRGEGRLIPKQLLEQVAATEVLVNQLNDQVTAEAKLLAIEQERIKQQKESAKAKVIQFPEKPKTTKQVEFTTDSFRLESLRANQEAQEELLAADREWRLRRVRQAEEEKEQLLKIEQAHRDSMLSSTASLFGSLASIVGSGSKKQFELSKKLARAETIISTYAAAQQAYAWTVKVAGPVAAGAAAAAAVAAGLARLAAINRTSFNSSSAAGAATGAGTFVPAPSSGPIAPGTNAAQGQTFIIITGGEVLTDAQLDNILERTKQRINEGSQVLIRRDSVQAQEIAKAVA